MLVEPALDIREAKAPSVAELRAAKLTALERSVNGLR
jgi:hypothetical protein